MLVPALKGTGHGEKIKIKDVGRGKLAQREEGPGRTLMSPSVAARASASGLSDGLFSRSAWMRRKRSAIRWGIVHFEAFLHCIGTHERV